jgi:4-amino-4-deoxy-L-arabinose transferase-like glycosyltransferase
MKTTVILVSRLQLPSGSRLIARVPDFVALMKPRVMVLAVFTALVGLMIAPGHLEPLLASAAVLAIAAGAGAAGTGPDNTNNVLALAFGVVIVVLVVAGSLWIMTNLNNNMMSPELMNPHLQH